MSEDSLQTSFWVMILVQTIGSVDLPGSGQRKMPSPSQYLAIVITWMVLQVVSGIGAQAARAAAALGWLLVVTGMVLGPFGKRVISVFNSVAGNATGAASTATGTAAESKIPGVSQILQGVKNITVTPSGVTP